MPPSASISSSPEEPNHALPQPCSALGFALLGLTCGLAWGSAQAELVQDVFLRHCAECRGPDRLGRIGPALLPENLGRLKCGEAAAAIAQGRLASQMLGFADKPVRDDQGKTSRVSAVYDAAPRHSFVAALKDIPELWEIQYRDDPLPVYNGPMHDYALDEGLARQTGPFPVRRIGLADYLDDFFFDPEYRLVLGASRDGKPGQVVHIDRGRKIAELDLAGMPHLGSGIVWDYQGHPVLATPNLKEAEVSVIDMGDWHTIKRIETLRPGFFMRSHEASPYAWVDVFFGPNKDAVHVIDKATLEIAKTLRPVPGKTAAHVEFDRYGKYVLLSVSEPAPDGALVIYDAATLEEVKRLPMNKPSGKYNVFNKITRSAGTSH